MHLLVLADMRMPRYSDGRMSEVGIRGVFCHTIKLGLYLFGHDGRLDYLDGVQVAALGANGYILLQLA